MPSPASGFLRGRQRAFAQRSADLPVDADEKTAIEGLQKRFKELQDQAVQYVGPLLSQ